MAFKSQWAYDRATGRFLPGGGYCDPVVDPATQGLAVLDRHPDLETERFDSERRAIRAATPQEIAAVASADMSRQLDEALATGTVIIAAAFAHLPEIVVRIQQGKWDTAAAAAAVDAVKTTAKDLLMQQLADRGVS